MNRAPSSREGQRSRKPSEDGAGLVARKPSDDGRDIWQEAAQRAKRESPVVLPNSATFHQLLEWLWLCLWLL